MKYTQQAFLSILSTHQKLVSQLNQFYRIDSIHDQHKMNQRVKEI